MDVVANEEKLGELILYVAGRLLDDPRGGATKINKVLFAAEFAHLRTYGSPITGVPYQKLDNGPAPRRLLPVRDELVKNGAAEMRREFYMGYPLDRVVPLREPDISLFSPDEITTVDTVVADLWDNRAVEVSEQSHEEMGWRMVALGETIPYEAAFLAPAFKVTDSMRAHARKLATERGL
jgi:hypothetical protein